MKTTTSFRVSILIALIAAAHSAPGRAASPINVGFDTKNLRVQVDVDNARWSAQVKGTPMQMNDVFFLPGDDASGWTITSSVNTNDANLYGSFVTVTLKGTKPGQLDFEYQVSASKTGNDILVSLGRSNNTGKAVDIGDMDYFVSYDARLGGTVDKWITLGTASRNRDYYDLWSVINLVTPKTYMVNHVVRDSGTGNSLLMGHVTTVKGASRFDVASAWGGKGPDRMQVRGYCSYKVTMPPGKSFAGEKLLIDFNQDALRAMEHQGDLIALANDIRLRERRPIQLDDKEWVANDYSRFHGYMSGGSEAGARRFFETNGLFDFYWGMGAGSSGSFGIYGGGGSTQGRPYRQNSFPADCFLPIQTVKYGGEKVIDFSNPKTIQIEHDRAFQWVTGHEKETGRAEMDFSDWWDKWQGQYDPYLTSLETYHAAGLPWRQAADQKAPKKVIRSNMNVVDHSYGIVDICRTSEDADGGYELGASYKHLLTESLYGSAIRFFYSGRVFWNDGDGFHIYKFNPSWGSDGRFNYGEGKVSANFHAIACNVLFVSEAFNEKYPDDRIELLKRISPPTMDVSYPVDLFARKPAQIWNLPIERPFGKWSVLAVFNFSHTGQASTNAPQFTTTLDAARDLRLEADKEYLAYEFWSKKFIGTFKGTFAIRPLNPYDCDVYSIVEKQNRPTLVSTSRHVRNMAFDIKDLGYDAAQRVLKGTSRAVPGDPYEMRIYVPEGFRAQRVELSDGIAATMRTEGDLLMVDFTTTSGKDVAWKVIF